MSQKWERIFTCDRCGYEARTRHRCSSGNDWAQGWKQLRADGESSSSATIDVCPACYDSYRDWQAAETAPKENDGKTA